mmetsp:Transcript_14580/g.31712  ORF Transcript_14580/g.31712 Transcript_14580/m.31712 type:complete len:236 (+) Transcript_14580:46-753(+)
MKITNFLSIILPASLAATTCTALSVKAPNNSISNHSSRRSWIVKNIVSASSAILSLDYVSNPPTAVADVDLRQYSALAPLGKPTSTGKKLTGLTLSELASRLSHDLVEGSTGQGGYFISGDISTQIFRDDCKFIDPTNSVSSLSRYQKALTILFDPDQSYVQLLKPLEIDDSEKEITARIRSGGILRLPWSPRISSYESTIKYTIDENGLIESQIQEWSVSPYQALKETFTPSFT